MVRANDANLLASGRSVTLATELPDARDWAAVPARRTRRFDPDRKVRIVDAALEVIAEHGVAGTTHRLIAQAADVPLGSLTYHFASLDDLRTAAFVRHAERSLADYAAHFDGVTGHDAFVEAVTDLIVAIVTGDALDWTVSYELYLAALRDPDLRAVTETWMQASRSVLERYVDPDTARDLDALIEGLSLHKRLSTRTASRDETRAAVVRMLPPAAFRARHTTGLLKPRKTRLSNAIRRETP